MDYIFEANQEVVGYGTAILSPMQMMAYIMAGFNGCCLYWPDGQTRRASQGKGAVGPVGIDTDSYPLGKPVKIEALSL